MKEKINMNICFIFLGFNSGVMGCMILLGNVSGAAVGTCFTVRIPINLYYIVNKSVTIRNVFDFGSV